MGDGDDVTQLFKNSGQHLVGAGVAQFRVEGLQVVDVEQQQRQGRAGLTRSKVDREIRQPMAVCPENTELVPNPIAAQNLLAEAIEGEGALAA